MLERPDLRPHLQVEIVEGEGVLLLCERGQMLLRGRLPELVIPCVDGRRSAAAIADHLQDQAGKAEVYYTLAQLEKKGYLTEAEDTLPAGVAALWSIQDIAPQTAARRLAETPVSVAAIGDVQAEPFQAALRALHVQVQGPGQLEVVLTDDYLRSALEAYNRQALGGGRPWLLVKPVGCQIWVGPVFRPGQTGCWACLAQRLRGNRAAEVFVQNKHGRAEPTPLARVCTPATLQIAWNLAATEVARWVARGGSSDLEGKLLTLDVHSWQTQTHTLVRRPQCPACGRPEQGLDGPARAVVLHSRKITFTQDGGHRASTPEETLERYGHHVSPITGAVSLLGQSVPPRDGVLHVYVAGENRARRHQSLKEVRCDLRCACGGKGASDVQARASALCEALERSSGIFQGDEPRRRARLKDLGDAAIHPNACMLFSARQYQQRALWNERQSRWNYVPVSFDEEAEVEWTPVWSLTWQAVRYLPTDFCYYAYPCPEEARYCIGCSNGNAAGNSPEEAILQGFLELVERDSVALWWYNRLRRPGVDLGSFGDPYLHRLTEYLRRRQRDLWALDLTADLQIPAFVALSRRTEGPAERIMMGFGAHLDARLALLRAVTELNQMLAWVWNAEGETPSLGRIDDPETVHWLQTATLANQPYLVPDGAAPPRKAADYPRSWADDLRDDVLACQALVERQGLEMLVLDQTRADIGMPVVKVIVPGLRHFWARFAPGRLYDVPVRLGWLPRPLTEEQLNPIAMFI
jgi:ribosomal protein S12 methylthiotransferase accessory factor